MTGKDAKYIHIHGKDAPQNERDILLTGDNAEFVEVILGDQTYERVTNKQVLIVGIIATWQLIGLFHMAAICCVIV